MLIDHYYIMKSLKDFLGLTMCFQELLILFEDHAKIFPFVLHDLAVPEYNKMNTR